MSAQDNRSRSVHGPHCVTCGDVAVPMRLLALEDGGMASCAADDGERELVDTTLLEPLVPGDRVLVHAGVAVARLRHEGSGG